MIAWLLLGAVRQNQTPTETAVLKPNAMEANRGLLRGLRSEYNIGCNANDKEKRANGS
jgi:hypothetical protein